MPNSNPQRSTAGIGMAVGAVAGAIVALVVQLATGDPRVWAYAIPIGVAAGVAIGAGAAPRPSADEQRPPRA